jgi:protein-S-isoprenylcysteine O-methyltransferase Ste14
MDRFRRIRVPVLTWILLASVGGAMAALYRLPDYRNAGWIVAMACWAALDLYWAWPAPPAPLVRPPAEPVTPPVASRPRLDVLVQSLVPYVLYCLPLSAVPILGQALIPAGRAHEFVGAAFAVVGLSVAIWARRTLGQNWSGGVALAGDRHALVSRGPYALARHPIYLGLIVGQVGLMIALAQVRALIFVAGIRAVLKKNRAEELALRAAYPVAYDAYARSVKRLVPWVW